MSRHLRFIQEIVAGLAGVAVVAFLFTRVVAVNASTAAFGLLIVVLATATARGLTGAVAASVAAALAYNYFFLPPVGEFTIADPENWVALFAFLATALVASHLSDRAQAQAAEARASQKETEQLYALSRAILLTDAARPIGPQAAQSIAQIFESPSVVILDAKSGALFRGGPADVDQAGQPLEPLLEDVVRQGSPRRDVARGLDIWPIALGGSPIGALGMAGTHASDGAVQSILNLVAIALERVRTEEAARRAEAARQSEELKSTLLDAIAHEFKTPLTSIKAAATGLRLGEANLPADQRELTTVIVEETDRLSQLVTEAVKMAEIDAGRVAPNREPTDLPAILNQARASFAGRGDDRVTIEADGAPLRVFVDRDLIVLALRQIIDNALKYSGPVSPIVCRSEAEDRRVLIRVADQGPGIPEQEQDRIFEKFYRRQAVRNRIPGTGLGLHIAREIARIHGGDLWAEPNTPRGAVFCLALPAADGVAG